MPTADEAAAMAAPAEERPAPVRYAFVVWMFAGIMGIVNGVDMLLRKQQLVDRWVRQNPDVARVDLERGANTLLWMFLVAAVAFAVLFTLFAYKAHEGQRRARLMLTCLCVLMVVFHFLVLGEVFGLTSALLGVIGTVLLYLPAANRFFAPRELPT